MPTVFGRRGYMAMQARRFWKTIPAAMNCCWFEYAEARMKKATAEFLEELDAAAEARRQAILSAEDALEVSGQTYYVSNDGDDAADGRTPETAWRTLARAGAAALRPGDGVRFRRGDLFRGQLIARPGVGYGAYGAGDKPRLYAWDFDLADPELWEL